MLKINLAQPFVSLLANRNGLLSRRDARVFNRDPYMRDAITALAVERYEAEVAASGVALDEDESPLIRFLNWLIENQESIRALIQMIMSLFNNEAEEDTNA